MKTLKFTKKNLLFFFASLLPLIFGYLSSLFTAPAITGWYTTLNKPSFNPPNWIFSPVWTTLFILMGISLLLILKKSASYYRRQAIFAFYIQLVLNVLWSFIFFYLNRPDLAFLEIIILSLAIVINIVYFWRLSRISAYLLVPYLAWVFFAAFLNYSICLLN